MKAKPGLIAMLILGSLSTVSYGEGDSVNEVVLYQVGKDGNYCLSITPNESGCVSGSTSDGDTVNLMEFVKGKAVVFRNLSDAPHDMKFNGANAEELPPQAPQASDAIKRFTTEDLVKNKISCSFHGAQLAVGYKVAGTTGQGAMKNTDDEGHKDGADGPKAGATQGQAGSALGAAGGTEGANGTGGGNLKITGLADVSRQVLAKGSASEVAKLVAARPELMEQLKEMRPLLASEIAPKIASAGGLKGPSALGGGLGAPGANGKGAQGMPTGAGVPGFVAGGTKIAGAAGGFGVIREDLTGGENSNDDDWTPGERPKSKRIQLPGGATLVLNKRMAPGGVERKGAGGRDIASREEAGEKGSFRTQLKPVVGKGRGWLNILTDGHTWLIAALLLAVGLTAKFAIAGTRKKSTR